MTKHGLTERSRTALPSGLPTGSAKGDIAVFDGTDWQILSVGGTDDDVLTEDSGETLGLKYATPSGGGGGGSGVAAGLINVALGKDYTLSTTHATYPDAPVDVLTDPTDTDWTQHGGFLTDGYRGSPNHNWTAGEGIEAGIVGFANATVDPVVARIDLEAAYDLDHVALWGIGGDAGVFTPSSIKVEYSDDDSAWTTVHDVTVDEQTDTNQMRRWYVKFDTAGNGEHRYWRFSFGNDTFIWLSEIECWAFAGSAPIGSQEYLGVETIGASNFTPAANNTYFQSIDIPAGGAFLASIEIYYANTGTVGNMGVVINADNAGSPGEMIGIGGNSQLTNGLYPVSSPHGKRWVSFPIARWLEEGTYWIGFRSWDPGTNQIAYETTGGNSYTQGTTNVWFSDGQNYVPTSSTNKYSMRASILRTTAAQGRLIPVDSPELYIYERPTGQTAHADDDEFDGPLSGWTELLVSGSDPNWRTSGGLLIADVDGQSSQDFAVLGKAITSHAAPMTIESAFTHIRNQDSGNHMHGLFFSDGLAAGSNVVSILNWSGSALWRFALDSGTFTSGLGGASGGTWDQEFGGAVGNRIFIRLIEDAANSWKIMLSWLGIDGTWTDFDMASYSFSMTPTHYGILISSWGSTVKSIVTADYFRAFTTDKSA